MKKIYATLLPVVAFATCAVAQKGIDGVINAEKSFAAYAVQSNTKDAFMQFLDSAAGIVFSKGKALNAYVSWSARKVNTAKLLWRPAFAGVSKSGDLGFTTGPWEYKNTLQDTALASGEYTTVWHLNDKGEWKFLVDIGTDFDTSAYSVSSIKKWLGKGVSAKGKNDALAIDKNFLTAYQSQGKNAFADVITAESWFNLQGHTPIKGKTNITAALAVIPSNLAFNPIAGGMASSNDIAYVYGTVTHDNVTENYLRIWQNTNEGYKLLVQVLKW